MGAQGGYQSWDYSSLAWNLRKKTKHLPQLQRRVLLEEVLKLLRVADELAESRGPPQTRAVAGDGAKEAAGCEEPGGEKEVPPAPEEGGPDSILAYLARCRRALNHLAAGMTLRRLDRPAEALEEMEKSLIAMEDAHAGLGADAPGGNSISSAIWHEKGVTLCDADSFPEAIAAFEHAIGLDPRVKYYSSLRSAELVLARCVALHGIHVSLDPNPEP